MICVEWNLMDMLIFFLLSESFITIYAFLSINVYAMNIKILKKKKLFVYLTCVSPMHDIILKSVNNFY